MNEIEIEKDIEYLKSYVSGLNVRLDIVERFLWKKFKCEDFRPYDEK